MLSSKVSSQDGDYWKGQDKLFCTRRMFGLGNTDSAVKDFESSQTGAVRWSLLLCTSLLTKGGSFYTVHEGRGVSFSAAHCWLTLPSQLGLGGAEPKPKNPQFLVSDHLKCMESSPFVASLTSYSVVASGWFKLPCECSLKVMLVMLS